MTTTSSHLKYAKALYETASKQQAEETVLQQLEALNVLFVDKSFVSVMKFVSYAPEATANKILDAAFKDKVNVLILNLLKILARARKISIVPKVAQAYRQLFHEKKGITDILVRSARKLHEAEEKRLIEKFKLLKGGPVSVRFEEDPQLIGGVQIYERGYLQDFSVQHYLHSLQKFLLNQEVDADFVSSGSTKNADSSPTQTQLF